MSVQSITRKSINRRIAGNNVWLGYSDGGANSAANSSPFNYSVLPDEEAVGQAMFDELIGYSKEKTGDIVIILLGGRGAQAMYKIINELSRTGEIDDLLARLHVFTQDALAPMLTETGDLEDELTKYLERLEALGGIDIFFLGFGPEAEAASHLCYIKPDSGGRAGDIAGIIPISQNI